MRLWEFVVYSLLCYVNFVLHISPKFFDRTYGSEVSYHRGPMCITTLMNWDVKSTFKLSSAKTTVIKPMQLFISEIDLLLL
jgi:hypothetical protein